MHKNLWSSAVWFWSYASGQTDRQTDRHTYHNTSHLSQRRHKYEHVTKESITPYAAATTTQRTPSGRCERILSYRLEDTLGPTLSRRSQNIQNVNWKRTASIVFLSTTNMPNTLMPIGCPFKRFRNTFICQTFQNMLILDGAGANYLVTGYLKSVPNSLKRPASKRKNK